MNETSRFVYTYFLYYNFTIRIKVLNDFEWRNSFINNNFNLRGKVNNNILFILFRRRIWIS